MSRLGTGVTRIGWLDAGQALLRDHGIEGVSVRALTEVLGVSKGSFYHHFEDLQDYLDALADYFSNEQLTDYFNRAHQQATEDPLTRITELGKMVLRNDGRKLMSSMRAWAKHNKAAAASVRKLDKLSLQFFEDVFRDLGFSTKESKLRAYLFVASTVVDIDAKLVGLTSREFEKMLLELTTR